MPKFLCIGDMHCTVESLEDCQKLADFILKRNFSEYFKVLMGDQYHQHGIVHVEVIKFWRRFIEGLGKTIGIVGNHDKPGGNIYTSDVLVSHEDQLGFCAVRDFYLQEFSDGVRVLFVSYTNDKERFIEICKQNPSDYVFCHQTFDGAKFENGFFAPDGIDLNQIPQKHVISGHIHKSQKFGKCFYVGSPRWMTLADASQEKGIWLLDLNKDTYSSEFFSTASVCRQIMHLRDAPDNNGLEWKEFWERRSTNIEWVVDIEGPPVWVAERVKLWAGKARIRTFPTSELVKDIRESDGISKAFQKYLDKFDCITSKQELLKLAQERCEIVT